MPITKTVFEWILNHWSLVAAAVGLFVQVTPIFKANPITALVRWLGKLTNADLMAANEKVMSEIADIKSELEDQKATIEENERDRIRWEILDFANSCKNGRRHTQDEFEHIIAINDKYEQIMKNSGQPNGVYAAQYEYILGLYHHCQETNSFL